MRIVTEPEFDARIRALLAGIDTSLVNLGSVTGPGRSGAVAAVYASHILRIPFIPFGSPVPIKLGRLLIIDTAIDSGKTLRKAERRYRSALPFVAACFHEPPRVSFWYEATKPQRYKHEDEKL